MCFFSAGINRRIVRQEILKGFFINILAFALSLGVSYIVATELDWNGKSMTWYQHTFFVIPLYCVPALAVHCIFYSQLTRNRESALSLGLKVQARLNGTNLLWALVTIALTVAGYRSAHVFMIPLLIVTLSNTVIGVLRVQNSSEFTFNKLPVKEIFILFFLFSVKKWLYIHLIGQIFVVLWTTHIYHLLIAAFIPIAGRSGATNNPDVTIGILCCFFTLLITSYLVPVIGLLNKPKAFLFALILAYALTRLSFIGFTHMEFPYRDDSDGNPTPQRHHITHSSRIIYDLNGRIQYTDSGYLFREWDRNAEKTIDSLTAPDTPVRQHDNSICNDVPFCGLPLYSCRQLHTGGFWLPGPAPILREEAQLKFVSKEKVSDFQRRFKFTVTGTCSN